ncbi:MAG: hypothetical protein VX519_11250 [Myxococcota bacterium]|nr:hypothetical protein [Myxococcota bacterium]
MAIPGIPGAPTPTFRTHDRVFLSLDELVAGVCLELETEGITVQPSLVKAAIQCARQSVQHVENQGLDQLAGQVTEDLRRLRIILVPKLIRQILVSYGHLVSELDIAETTDLV